MALDRPLTVALCVDGVDDDALIRAALPWLRTFDRVEVWCGYGDEAARELDQLRERHGRPNPPRPPHHDIGPDRKQATAIAERVRSALRERGIGATTRVVGDRDAGHAVAAAAGSDVALLLSAGHRGGLGPKSIGHTARFIIDHAAGPVILVKL